MMDVVLRERGITVYANIQSRLMGANGGGFAQGPSTSTMYPTIQP